MKVIIVGAGMSGATLALALSQQLGEQLEIELVEPFGLTDDHPGFDARAIAIAHGTEQKLRQFNLWSHFEKHATPIKKIWVTEQFQTPKVSMVHDDYHVDALGHVISLFDVGQSMMRAMNQTPRIKAWSGYKVKAVNRELSQVEVRIEPVLQQDKELSEVVLSADLLVVADGTHSACAELLKIEKQSLDYHQYALIANIQTSIAHQGQAFEVFTKEGPLALLPFSEGRSTLVWCGNESSIHSIMTLEDDEFLLALHQAFGNALGSFIKTGQRHIYPLKRQVINKSITHRTVFIGNAAQTLHPIAGQGFNLGMRDIYDLYGVIEKALNEEKDIGDYGVLTSYWKKRQRDREETLFLTHGLVSLFSNNRLEKRMVRKFGLQVLPYCRFLKDRIAFQALGWKKGIW